MDKTDIIDALRFIWDVLVYICGGVAACFAISWLFLGISMKNTTLETIPTSELLNTYAQIEPLAIIVGLFCGLIYCAYFKGIKEGRRRQEILNHHGVFGFLKESKEGNKE